MEWLAIVVLLLIATIALSGYFLPRLAHALGWALVAGAIPLGLGLFWFGLTKTASCGGMVIVICQWFMAGVGLVAAIISAVLGWILLGSAKMARSKKQLNTSDNQVNQKN